MTFANRKDIPMKAEWLWDRKPVSEGRANVMGKELVKDIEAYLRGKERSLRVEVEYGVPMIEDYANGT